MDVLDAAVLLQRSVDAPDLFDIDIDTPSAEAEEEAETPEKHRFIHKAKEAFISGGKELDSIVQDTRKALTNLSNYHPTVQDKKCNLTKATNVGSSLYLVDNSKLQASTNGVGYRFRKVSWDRDVRSIARWGSTVRGTEGDGWLQVGDCYLPMKVQGTPVLKLQDSKATSLLEVRGVPTEEKTTEDELGLNREAFDKEGVDENGLRIGDHMEVIVTQGLMAGRWLKCLIEGRDPSTGLYNLHLPHAPAKYRHATNIPLQALRRPEESDKSDGILFFFAVSSREQVIDLVTANINHLRASYPGRADVYLVHTDEGKAEWIDRNKTWYIENVQYSQEHKLSKMTSGASSMLFKGAYSPAHIKLGKTYVPELLARRQYQWIWLVDEDLDFSQTDLVRLFKDAEKSGSLIVAPSVKFNDNANGNKGALQRLYTPGCNKANHMCYIHVRRPACQWRYTNFIEAMFPILSPDAFKEMFSGCENCDGQIDRLWCSRPSTMLVHAPDQACAILDQVSVTHTNGKTLRKWEEISQGHDGLQDVAMAHPGDWVEAADIGTFSCVE